MAGTWCTVCALIDIQRLLEQQYHSKRLDDRGGELCSLRDGDRAASAHCNRRRLAQAGISAPAPPAAPAAAPAAVKTNIQQLDVTMQSREVPKAVCLSP